MQALVDRELPEKERAELARLLETGSVETAEPRLRELHSAYKNLLTIKKLVQTKTKQPQAPARLRAEIEADLARNGSLWGRLMGSDRSARSSRRRALATAGPSNTRRWSLAAALVLGTTLAVSVAIISWPKGPRLAHGAMVKRCAEAFLLVLEANPEPPLQPGCELYALDCLQASTGKGLDRLPVFPGAILAGCERVEWDGVCGVRLDYFPEASSEEASDSREVASEDAGPFCVFAFSVSTLGESQSMLRAFPDGKECYCVQLPDTSVYCFRSKDLVFNVLARQGAEGFPQRYRPVAAAEVPRAASQEETPR